MPSLSGVHWGHGVSLGIGLEAASDKALRLASSALLKAPLVQPSTISPCSCTK